MIEAGANQVEDDIMLDAILKGHEEIKKIVAFISDIQAQIGKKKFEFESQEVDHDMFDAIEEFASERVKFALDTNDKIFVRKDFSLSRTIFMKSLTRFILNRLQ